MNSAELERELELTLKREAWLLDHHRYEEWLDLLTDDARYWAPVRSNVMPEDEHLEQNGLLAHFDDSKEGLRLRIQRLRTGFAHVETPPSRVRHFVSNVMVLATDGEREAKVASNFIVYRNRLDRQEAWFVGYREDKWQRIGDRWRMAERMITFDHNVIEAVTCFF